mgnify:CR=1 FL=1
MAKTRVWVLTALFTTDNVDETKIDVLSVHSSLDDAMKQKDKCFEETKKDWLDEGMTEEEMYLINHSGVSVLKAKDNTKQVEYGIYGKDIDNGY